MDTDKRVFIVSNRLPVKIVRKHGALSYQTSEGGLATGVGSIYKKNNNLWIGWPGTEVPEEEKAAVNEDLAMQNLYPVFLTQEEINDYYEGFSNETLWPLFHYFPTYASYEPQHWDIYRQANRKFADAVIRLATKDDIVWIHDYQLMLVPQMVREAYPEISIGFFNHIPFPSFEIFRLLPWRKELLRGMMGADVIGFHTYDDVRHFISAAGRIVNVTGTANELFVENRLVTVDAFPISIDYNKYHQLAESTQTRRIERRLRQLVNYNKLIISIDRLDYSKGVPHRLRAYELLLERYPQLKGKITHIQLIVPSRDAVPTYRDLKEEIDKLVSHINGRFGSIGWQPIQHFYRAFPPHLLSALYKTADIALVTPMRDGMNLVSKEYIASRTDQKGVLILSEMAGAARELSEALIVNPNDIWQVCETIYQALHMPEEEQRRRIATMQQTVSTFDIQNWVNNFMDKLQEVKAQQQSLLTRTINASIRQKISIRYHFAAKRLIFLDYDGTLVPFYQQVQAARPDEEILALLRELCDDPANKIVITSGRDYQTLDSWLGHLDLNMIAEHGAWYKDAGKSWRNRRDLNNDWKQDIRNVMNMYVNRTPGALVEEKSYSLAWHYRKTETGLGTLRAQELMEDIRHFVGDRGLQMLQGDKVLEVKSMSVNKGKAAKRWLEQGGYDFIMAIGDDHTDEDTFKAMPGDAITIKVGSNISAAAYFLHSYEDVRTLLREICRTTSSIAKVREVELREAD